MPPQLDLKIAHLYAHLLNIYGDRGNILTLTHRSSWRGINVEVEPVNIGQKIDPDYFDLYFIGGGQDKQQLIIAADLIRHTKTLAKATENGAVILAICGGYQLLGHYYKPHDSAELKGISLLDAYTVAGNKRMIGNVVVKRSDGSTLVGFENHSGKTYLANHVQALGKVVSGHGNNGEDQLEGAVFGNIYGTYLHGSLLPKNPRLADELIGKALMRRHGQVLLEPLNDDLETKAHKQALILPA